MLETIKTIPKHRNTFLYSFMDFCFVHFWELCLLGAVQYHAMGWQRDTVRGGPAAWTDRGGCPTLQPATPRCIPSRALTKQPLSLPAERVARSLVR